MIDSNFV